MRRTSRPHGYLYTGLVLTTLLILLGIYAWHIGTARWEIQAMRDMQAAEVPGFRQLAIGLAVAGNGLPWAGTIGGVALVVLLLGSLRLVLLLGLVTVLQDVGALLKMLVERARPSVESVEVWRTISSYSFPSGHTLGATLIFGFLFLAAGHLALPNQARRCLQGFSLAVIVLMGLSRVQVGAHWPTDVLAAYLLGALLLLPIAYTLRAVEAHNNAHV